MYAVKRTLVSCGITHKTASLERREPFQLAAEEVPRANALLAGLPSVLECAVLSTCNRVEFYLVTAGQSDPFETVAAFYKLFKGFDVTPFRRLFRARKGRDVANHLFRVAAGIDSMVLGENQILGQVKDAYSAACRVESAGKVIHRLFHQTFRVGKQVRADTGIGKGACSVSTAALEMLGHKLSTLESPTVLFIGVNRMIRIAADRLDRMENRHLLFANRTADKARALAAGFDSEGYGLDDLSHLISQADVIISCTSSPEPIVTNKTMAGVLANRPQKQRVMMDMAVPRDIGIAKDYDPSVEIFDLEDISRFVARRQRERRMEIPHAEELIGHRLNEFEFWFKNVIDGPASGGVVVDALPARETACRRSR